MYVILSGRVAIVPRDGLGTGRAGGRVRGADRGPPRGDDGGRSGRGHGRDRPALRKAGPERARRPGGRRRGGDRRSARGAASAARRRGRARRAHPARAHPASRGADRDRFRRSGAHRGAQVPGRDAAVALPRTQRDSVPRGRSRRGPGCLLAARALRPEPGELPIVVLPDGTVLKNPTKQDLARALGLVATSFRSEPYDVAIVGAGPAGLATAVYGASEGSRSSCWKRSRSEDRPAPARASRTIWAFRPASPGRR